MSYSSEPRTGPLGALAGERRLHAQLLSARDRSTAMHLLREDARENLLLLDTAAALGTVARREETAPRVVGAFDAEELVSLAAVRPSLVIHGRMEPEAMDVIAPHLEGVPAGLVKSPRRVVDPLWLRIRRRGRRAVLDRIEIAYAVETAVALRSAPLPGAALRAATEADLDALVFAARASLREEDRPDPFTGDPKGFRRWVRGRIERARVVESAGRVVFVAYADVRRAEGWLVQGVYTWPNVRRRGFAQAGMAALVREAGVAGADHVQLAVVEGNQPAIGLYEGLGFEPFGELRTILFV